MQWQMALMHMPAGAEIRDAIAAEIDPLPEVAGFRVAPEGWVIWRQGLARYDTIGRNCVE